MSEENVEIVRGAIDAMNRGDWDAALNLRPDQNPDDPPHRTNRRGRWRRDEQEDHRGRRDPDARAPGPRSAAAQANSSSVSVTGGNTLQVVDDDTGNDLYESVETDPRAPVDRPVTQFDPALPC